jgi:putative transposase
LTPRPSGASRPGSPEWTNRPGQAQQLREATPFGTAPRSLIRDYDSSFEGQFAQVAAGSRIAVLRTPVRAPRANAACERFLGSVRRGCLDHLLILHAGQLRRALRDYWAYYNAARPHQGLGRAIPGAPKLAPVVCSAALIVAIPILGGLHYDYRRAS